MVVRRQETRRRGWWARAYPRPGAMIGRYQVLEHLDSGGMASVYLVRIECSGGFHKRLALKLLHHGLAANPVLVEMFFHEARVLSRLQHPNIVQVVDLDQWDGTYFIVMEHLAAQPLTEVMRGRGSLAPRLVCGLGLQACEALHYLHEATDEDDRPLDLVHLDVSPQNLMLTDSGSLKLIDFGISRSNALDDVVPANPFRAKYSYTSPERLTDSEPDRRSDIFSLGTVLWELLVGRRLFSGDNDLQTMYRVSQAEIPPLAEERSDIPAALDAVVRKALCREPGGRYQTALELFEALDSVRGVLGPPVTTIELSRLMSEWFPQRSTLMPNPV